MPKVQKKPIHRIFRVLVLAGSFGIIFFGAGASFALASLTFTGSTITSDSGIVLDGNGNISIGTSTATGITIGKSGITTSFPGTNSVAGYMQSGNNLSELTATSSARTNIGFTGGSKITISAAGAIGLATTSISQWVNDSGYVTSTGSGSVSLDGLSSSTFTLNGTANQITIATSGTNVLTWSLPQNIAVASSPTFGNLVISTQATTTNLSITGLAGASGCLSVSATGVVTTSTCSGGGGGSGTVTTSTAITTNNFPFWGTVGGALSGTSTLTINGTTLTQSNAFNVGGNLNVTGTATFVSTLTQSGGLASLASTTITGQATTTNLSITGLAGASGCLSVSATGVVTTSTCSGSNNATQIQGRNVTSTAPTDGQFLKYVNANSDWEPAAGGAGTGNVNATAANTLVNNVPYYTASASTTIAATSAMYLDSSKVSIGTSTFANTSTTFQVWSPASNLTASSAVTVFIGDASSSRPGCIAMSEYPTGTAWGYIWLDPRVSGLIVATSTPCP